MSVVAMRELDSQAPTIRQRGRRRSRLALVGCGPRGLQVLESLSRHLTPSQLSQMDIVIFEPASCMGAGAVYDPDQSHVLRMNFATQFIDFWKPIEPRNRRKQALALIDWLREHYPQWAEEDNYIPRAVVGEYLRDCYSRVMKRLRRFANVEVNRSSVRSISSSSAGWVVRTKTSMRRFDRVVLTTGHEGIRGSESDRESQFVFPPEEKLSPERVPSKSSVQIKGMGLTAIDAVLMLTEGRHGAFGHDSARLLPSYTPSDSEPSTIHLVSRSGRPMLAKPTNAIQPIDDGVYRPFRRQLAALQPLHGQLDFRRQVWPVVVAAAAELLHTVSIRSSGSDDPSVPADSRDVLQGRVSNWYRDWTRYKMDGKSARHAMLQSYAVATGNRPMDIPFALGAAWRALYPQLVALISFGGLLPQHWQCYEHTAREMERIAFGPPAENLGKLLTLIREGIVTLGCIDETDSARRFDVKLNAVLAKPHQSAVSGPTDGLIESQAIHRDAVSGGIQVDDIGAAIGAPDGLHIFGRMTEGWIVGNDTLSRELHHQIDAWAESMAGVLDE